MDNSTILSIILNGALGVAVYFMQIAHTQTKETLQHLREDVEHVKEKYFKKEDFRDFKQELWNRLDKMEEKLSQNK
jgi:septation ring formation regulator EzrA